MTGSLSVQGILNAWALPNPLLIGDFMLKKFARFLPILLAVLIVFSLVQSAPVQAEDPVYDQQVLIVHYVDRDQLADLANRYDVVESIPIRRR